MKMFNRRMGKFAEDLAINSLKEKNYTILERNFSNRFGEIDIIAKDKETLVFVEVKAKTETNFGMPEEMITGKKLEKVRRMATVYTQSKPFSCRIDVIAIVLTSTGKLMRLTHYENVY